MQAHHLVPNGLNALTMDPVQHGQYPSVTSIAFVARTIEWQVTTCLKHADGSRAAASVRACQNDGIYPHGLAHSLRIEPPEIAPAFREAECACVLNVHVPSVPV